MMGSPDVGAVAAYRGYRRQLSYTLGRVLAGGDQGLSYQPEGVEDLAIWRGSELIEACQIKAIDGTLQPSDLRSRGDSFFKRAARLVSDHPRIILRVVSFGPVGQELTAAIAGQGAATQSLIGKLVASDGLSRAGAAAVLQRTELEIVDEDGIRAQLLGATRDLLTSADPDASLDLLHWWMFTAAEGRRMLGQPELRDAVVNTGRYVTEWASRNLEWFTSIEPVVAPRGDVDQRRELAAEYYRGAAARPEHIAADLDVERPAVIDAIDRGFGATRVVVIRGASGQGKSTAALRYLQRLPDAWRFRVRLVEGRRHAASIGVALASQAELIKVPLLVWIDVSPRDEGWTDLVARLTENPNVQILVTVREEDWRRSQFPAAEVQFTEVELELDRVEASGIFNALVERRAAQTVADFGDAWTRFGGGGPLLEFVHLVTQDASLRERLTEQVRRLEDETRTGNLEPAELELLRSVAVASAYEATIDAETAARALGLRAPRRTIELFEREFLLRSSDDKRALGGVHPIRSGILADLLCDDRLRPWLSVAQKVLPWMPEQDWEIFLMSAFVHRPSDRGELSEMALGLPAETWSGMAGVGRALLWLGVADYADGERIWIDELVGEYGEAAWLTINRDVADAMPEAGDVIKRLAEIVPQADRLRSISAIAQAHRGDPGAIWTYLRRWLGSKARQIGPLSPADLSDAGQVCFWSGRLGVGEPTSWLDLRSVDLSEASLDALADGCVGMAEAGISDLLEESRPQILERFRRETLTLRLLDDGNEVSSDFVVPLDGENRRPDPCQPHENLAHRETMRRAWLLRRLYPGHEFYACQGHGHRMFDGQHDDTTKRIPRRNLPLDWLTSINATFAGYLELGVRPPTWHAYLSMIQSRRQAVLAVIAAADRALTRYHRSADDAIIGRSLDYGVIQLALDAVAPQPRLPAVAVDPWGLVTEGRREDAAMPELSSRRPMALDRYRLLVSSTRRWNQAAENFLRAAGQVLATAPPLARAKSETVRQQIRDAAAKRGMRMDLEALSRSNLRDLVRGSAQMQRAMKLTLSTHLPPDTARLDSAETRAYGEFAAVWEHFTRRPGVRYADVGREAAHTRGKSLRNFTKALLKSNASLDGVELSVMSDSATWCGDPVLALRIDASVDALDLLRAGDEAVDQIAVAAQSMGDLAQAIFSASWPAVALIWSFRGLAVDTTAFFLNTDWLQDQNRALDWWRFVPKARPDDLNEAIGIEVWDSYIAADGAALVSAVADVWAYASHLADLVSLEVDEASRSVVTDHISRISDEQSQRLQVAIDAMESILGAISEPSSPSADSIASELRDACREIHDAILPPGFKNGQARFQLNEVAQWRDRVAEARTLALAARLLLLTLQAGT